MEQKAVGTARRKYIWSLGQRPRKGWAAVPELEQTRITLSALARMVPDFLICLLGASARFAGGTLPFAMGLQCAFALSGRALLAPAVGGVLGALLAGDPVQALCVCLFFALWSFARMLRQTLSDLSLLLLAALIAAGLPQLFLGSVFDRVSAGLCALAAVLLALPCAAALKIRWHERELLAAEEMCGVSFLCVACLAGLAPVQLYGVSPFVSLSLFFCLLAGCLGGAGMGAVVGAGMGAVNALAQPARPELAAGMALCGLVCGLFGKKRRVFGVLGLLPAVLLSSALNEVWIAPAMLIQLLLAALLCLLVPTGVYEGLKKKVDRECEADDMGRDIRAEARNDLRLKLDGLSQLYARMAKTIGEVSGGGRQYAAIAEALGGEAAKLRAAVEPDEELKSRCLYALDRARLPVYGLQALREEGRLCLRVRLRSRTEEGQRQAIVHELSAVVGYALKAAPGQAEGEQLLLVPAARFHLLAGAACRAGGGDGEVCGDTYLFRELPNDRYMLAVSDGMGRGRQAGEESAAAVELLEEYLLAGFSPEAAILGVNDLLLRRKKGEMFATMDLGVIDLKSGVLHLNKIGAVQSYIRRGRELIRLSGGALPMGIVDSVNPYRGETQLQDGDLIVMLSDGLADQSAETERWLEEALLSLSLREPGAAARSLLEAAARERALKDDSTVLIARVLERSR